MTSRSVQAESRTAAASLAVRARRALGDAPQRTRPGAGFDAKGYVVLLEDNLLAGVALADIEAAFGAGAGQELEGKMRAPWSSSALAVNSFAPWQRDPRSLTLAGVSGFTGALAFEAKCPNGVSTIPPHLDALLERDEAIVGVESKCTECLSPKASKVAAAYLALATRGDERAASRWFAALADVPKFRFLDAYQLVKHYLGLARSYPGRPLMLVYIYWEPANARALPLFDEHRGEVERFGELVAGDTGCRFEALSYGEHWRELDTLRAKPAWRARARARPRGRQRLRDRAPSALRGAALRRRLGRRETREHAEQPRRDGLRPRYEAPDAPTAEPDGDGRARRCAAGVAGPPGDGLVPELTYPICTRPA